MDIRELEYFLAVADHGSVTRAAQVLHVSQPAVSQVIRGLEGETGQPLFHRTPTGVVLTQTGLLLKQHALKIMHVFEDTQEALNMDRHRMRQLRLGVLPTLAHDYVPAILRSFLQAENMDPEHMEATEEISVMQGSTQELLHSVKSGDLNLAIVDLPVSEPSLSVARLWREPLVVIKAVDTPLLKSPLPFQSLANEVFITMETGYGLRDALFRNALDNGFQPKILFELKSIMAVVGFVQAGFGISLVSARTVSLETELDRLQAVETVPPLSRDIGIVWRNDRRLPPFARRFQEYFLEQAKLLAKTEGDIELH
ncbi:LysR family transcriptional regulator [Alicyclobacillus sp. SO9]|uniref:LysR family transcriptional regulator n=1 Tax=Alicyclobacillus sp. SO9 TaxID=2665646 RepID=UPI0018E89105|nr:LysR family transcriptional regulator [Alicyclobacillus sp. SO9]QQE78173.1 LysR family transcriptional regulator [Alicyclobacillus sp. SO9]